MEKEVGNKNCAIWLLGDSNPKNWQDILVTPLDPRHPARHSIWTSVLDVIQDNVFRQCRVRVDTSAIYIRNAIEDSYLKPPSDTIVWNEDVVSYTYELSELLKQHQPALLFCFGAFSFEFARRALNQEPNQAFGYWGARSLGDQFKKRINEFNPTNINAIPLLHTSISRGRFIESHNYFSGQEGGNYFDYVGNAIANKLIQYQSDLQIWIT
jgi:hypothetical protein